MHCATTALEDLYRTQAVELEKLYCESEAIHLLDMCAIICLYFSIPNESQSVAQLVDATAIWIELAKSGFVRPIGGRNTDVKKVHVKKYPPLIFCSQDEQIHLASDRKSLHLSILPNSETYPALQAIG